MSQVHTVGDELGADAGRVGGLGAALADLVPGLQDPVHGADTAVVGALVEQHGPGLGRGLVSEPVAVEDVEDLLPLLVRQGGGVRGTLARGHSPFRGHRVFPAVEGCP
jgi:hypothetical protein